MDTGTSYLGIFVILLILAIGIYLVWANRNKTLMSSSKEKSEIPKSSENAFQPKTEIIKSKQDESESKPEKTRESPKIFVSYRRDDSINITGRIYDRLVQQFGADNVFKDVDSIPLGVDFRKHLDQVLAQCSVSLIVIGTNWLYNEEKDEKNRLLNSTDFVRIEVESALQRDIPVIPLFVQEATMPLEENLPDTLKSLVFRNGISIRPDPDFHNDINRLIRAIHNYVK